MPVKFSVLPSIKTVVIQFSGYVTQAEFLAMISRQANDPTMPFSFTKIVDHSRMEDNDLCFERVMSIMGNFQRAVRNDTSDQAVNSMLCVVYAPSDLAFATSRIFESIAAMSDEVEIYVYRTPEDVMAKAGMPDMTLSQLSQQAEVAGWREIDPMPAL